MTSLSTRDFGLAQDVPLLSAAEWASRARKSQSLLDALWAGQNARAEAIASDRCPFDRQTERALYYRWLEGWQLARDAELSRAAMRLPPSPASGPPAAEMNDQHFAWQDRKDLS